MGFIPCQSGAREPRYSCHAVTCQKKEEVSSGSCQGVVICFFLYKRRRGRAIKVILATWGWKMWLLMVIIKTTLFPSFLVRDFCVLVSNEQLKLTPHLSVGDFFIRWQRGRWSQLKFLFALCYAWALSSCPDTYWPRTAACWELFPFWKKAEMEDPCLAQLGNFLFSWLPVMREQEKNRKEKEKKRERNNIANSAHFSSQRV